MKTDEMKRRAEQIIAEQPERMHELPAQDIQELIHELQVHQIELEMQNDELRKAQLEVETSRRKYHDLYDFAPVGYFTLDERGIILEVNLAGAVLLGVERRYVVGRGFSSFLAPESQERFYYYREQAQATKREQHCEIKIIWKNGASFYVKLQMVAAQYDADETNHIQVTATDINDRKRAEDVLRKSHELLERLVDERTETLRKSEAQYRELVQNANSIIYRRDTEGNITFFNEYAQHFFGYSEDEILGKNVVGTIVPETDSAGNDLTAMIADISTDPDRYAVNENENMRCSGERIWIAWTNKAIRDEEGTIQEILCVGSDMTERRVMQKKLQESESWYRTLFETTGAGTVIIEDDMTISLANEEFTRITDYSKEEIEGRRWNEFVAEKDLEMMMAYHRRRRGDPLAAPSHYECTLVDKQGTERDNLISISMIPGTKKSIASFLDITEQKHLARELHESLTQYRLLADNVLDVIWTMDINLRFTYISPSISKLLDYNLDEIQGILIKKILTPHSWKVVQKLWQQFREAVARSNHRTQLRKPLTAELELIHKDGSVVHVETQMTYLAPTEEYPEAILGVARDITQRKRYERERWETEYRYHVLFDHSPMGVIHYDTDFHIIDCNEAAAAILGTTREHVVDFDLKRLEDRSTIPALTAPFEGNVGVFEGFYRTTTTRTELWMALRTAPLYGSDGTIDGGVALIEDISNRVQTQQALEIETRSLAETNTALKVLYDQVETNRQEFQSDVFFNVKQLILPYIEKLRVCRTDNDRDTCLQVLETNLHNIVSPFLREMTMGHYSLTPKELHVATLVKEGKTNKEIADLLHLSKRSVEFHRDNIREKCGLKNKKANLRSFLLSLK